MGDGQSRAGDVIVGIPAGTVAFFFTDAGEVTNFAQSTACDQERFRTFFHAMLNRGIYLAPSAFEAGFVSAAHSEEEIDATIQAAGESFSEIS